MRMRVLWCWILLVVGVLGAAAPAAAQGPADVPAAGAACDEATLDETAKVLVFTEVAGFAHDSRDEGVAALCAIGAGAGIAVDHVGGPQVLGTDESAGVFTDATLAQYDAVAWLSTTSDVLTAAEQTAFEDFIQAGNGYVGIHAASDTEYSWPWYGELVGAYFDSHPANQNATVKVTDHEHPATEGLPHRWQRFDEWYNFEDNPRGDVHVLATLDETTYSGGNMGVDHPTAWCQRYDGGRSFYTGGGHTAESFSEPLFRQHLSGGLQWAAGLAEGNCSGTVWNDYERVTLAKGAGETGEPIGLTVLPDRGVLHTSRGGRVWHTDASGTTTVAADIPVYQHDEDGLQAITIDPDFATNKWVYVYMAPPLNTPGGDAPEQGTQAQFDAFKGVNQLARFKFDDAANTLDLATKQVLLEVDQDRGICCHNGGDFAWDAEGNLYLSTGDDTNPFQSEGYSPIDEQATRNPAFDAQRSSANTNDLRGKILRIDPDPVEDEYTVPAGNLFAPGTMGTRPEIYAMGFRNPFRIGIDPATGILYVGDYGPDAGAPSAQRGPGGQVEFNVVAEAGNYGWPYCTGDNDAYVDWNFATKTGSGSFNCAAPVNNSPRNTGLTNLPPAELPAIWYGNGGPWEAEMAPGGSESPMGGPVYRFDPDNPSETKFPQSMDGHAFFYEWDRRWIKDVALDAEGQPLEVSPFLDDPAFAWVRPMDIEFGPEGALYVLTYGGGFFGGDPESALYRVDHVAGGRRPIAELAASDTSTSAETLTVEFSSEGSRDPDGDTFTYSWDFDGDGEEDSAEPNPTHTYAATGTYTARLTLTDTTGKTGSADVRIVVGNAEPVVELILPPEGAFFEFGDQVPFEVRVTDEEDGVIEAGDPECSRIRVDYLLGHDTHSHPITDTTGCTGTIQTARDGGHGDDANLYGVFSATYTDQGGKPGTTPVAVTEGVQLWPKLLQAEHYTSMRGIQTVADGGAGGGERVGYTDGAATEGVNYVAWDPVNLLNIDSLTITASSGGGGGQIQVRLDDPEDGQLLGTVQVPNTGDWTVHRPFELDLAAPVSGTHTLYLVFPTGGLDVDQVRFNGKGASSNARPVVSATASPTRVGKDAPVTFDGTASDPDGGALTYLWEFGDGATATTLDATHSYAAAGVYDATLTVTDPQGATATAEVQVEVTDCAGTPPAPSDEFAGASLDLCRWSEIVRPAPNLREVSDGRLRIDTNNGTDMYGDNTNAQNLVLQPAPDGAWTATTKVSLPFQGKDYEQASLLLYGDDDNFAKLSWIKVPAGRQFEFILQDGGAPVDGGAVDRTPLVDANFPNEVYMRLTSDGTFVTAAWSVNGTDWTQFGRARALSAVGPDPKVGLAAFNGAGNGNQAAFDFFRLEDGGPVEDPCEDAAWTADPGYRLLFDGTTESVADWKMAGPGGFNLTQECTLESFGGLGMLYHEDTFEGPHTIKLEWMMPGDENSGVFIGNWPDSTDPFVAVNQGYEVQIDPSDDADSTTGAIYNFQAADAAKREAALNPFGQWNTYEITVDDPKVTVRLNGVVINEFTSTDPARDLSSGRVGLQNHGNGDEVYFRRVQVKEHAPAAGGLPCSGGATGADDQFDGDALNGCRWDRTVRYDPATLDVSDGRLHIETSGTDIYGTGDTGTTNMVLQDAPAGDWTATTKVSAPLTMCCQQAGLIVYGSDDDYVKLDPIAENDGRIRFELRSEVGDVVQNPQPNVTIDKPQDQTYWLRLTKTGNSYAGEFSLNGTTWTPLGESVQNAALAQDAAVGVYALGVFQDAPVYASFDFFDIEADGPGGEPGAPTVTAYADPATSAAPHKVNLTATALDPDGGEIVRYEWTIPGVGTAFGPTASATFTTAGTRTVTLTVTDDEGDTASDTVDVVTTTNGAPPEILQATADRTSGPAPLGVLFDAVATDPDGGPLTYRWDFDDNGQALGAEAEHTFAEPGEYEVTLTVTDQAGNTDTATIAVTVTDPAGEEPPTVEAAALPAAGDAPLAVIFSAHGTDPDGGALTYAWDFGDGTTAKGRRARHTYTTNGTYTATVTATDAGGDTATDTVQVVVGNPAGNQAPVVQAAADPNGGTGPLTVTLTAAGSDPDGDALAYEWDFGDGQKAGGTKAVHTYSAAGTYTAKVTATDGHGGTGEATVTITVAAAVSGGGATPAPAAPGPAARPAIATVGAPKLPAYGRRGLTVVVACGDLAAPGEARVALSKAAARRLGLRSRSLGRRALTCAAGETVKLRLKPGRKVRRAITATRPKALALSVTVAIGDGERMSRRLTLKR